MDWIPLLSSYPMWVRIFMLIWIVVAVGILVLAPRKPLEDKPENMGRALHLNEPQGNQHVGQINAGQVNIFQSAGRAPQHLPPNECMDLVAPGREHAGTLRQLIKQFPEGSSIEFIRAALGVAGLAASQIADYINELYERPIASHTNYREFGEELKRLPFDGLPSGLFCYAKYDDIDSFGEFAVVPAPADEMHGVDRSDFFELHRIEGGGTHLVAFTKVPQQNLINQASTVTELLVMNEQRADMGFVHPILVPVYRIVKIEAVLYRNGFLLKVSP